jgi:ssDNA-binding Zn-finger/Zn-ribbon topoisomerase 1
MKQTVPIPPNVNCGYRGLLRRPARRSVSEEGLLPCPKCGGPLTLRMGRRGPYFHCACTKETTKDTKNTK